MVKFYDVNKKMSIIGNVSNLLYPDGSKLPCVGGVYDLRPDKLESQHKENEEKIHDSTETYSRENFLYDLVYYKAGHIRNTIDNWVPIVKKNLKAGDVFVEIAGGLNYVSAIVKNEFPELTVCATDISVQYLRNKSRPLAENYFSRIPDFYIACDAENLPFENASVDCIWTHSSLHHFDSVVRFLEEAKRVLKPGGLLIAKDSANPYLFSRKESALKKERGSKYGVNEIYYTYFDWKKIAQQCNLKFGYTMAKTSIDVIKRILLNSKFNQEIVISNVNLYK